MTPFKSELAMQVKLHNVVSEVLLRFRKVSPKIAKQVACNVVIKYHIHNITFREGG